MKTRRILAHRKASSQPHYQMILSQFNLPQGLSSLHIDRNEREQDNRCQECGDYLQTMTEIDLQLCAVHLQQVMEHLPET